MTTAAITRALFRGRTWPRWTDVVVFAFAVALFYGVLAVGRTWFAPFTPVTRISRSPRSLPFYAAYSLVRIAVAYALSLFFAVSYGYLAAYWTRAERFLIAALDVLQSLPVLSFLPGVMLAFIALFPHSRFGLELGSIVLIFTGQAWNIAFSFYSSLKSIPQEMRETACIYRLGRWQRFTQLELPYSAIGLVWNSMMSVAGAWFFLMACEMFFLGDRDFRLPGLGSYLQIAASAGDTPAIIWGLAAMISVIVLLDQLVWRPLIAWADKFKFEQVESASVPRSAVLDALHRSRAVAFLGRKVVQPLNERFTLALARRDFAAAAAPKQSSAASAVWLRTIGIAFAAVAAAAALYGLARAGILLSHLNRADLIELGRGAAATFLRVNVALVIAALWAVPAGVAVGLSPRLARIAQPLAEIAASVPATALFPVLLLILFRFGGGMNLAALLLMLLGTQWYILFNVIAGAMAIPTDLKEASSIFRFPRWERWRRLILPGIFPFLVTGLLTAAGGAWNASIVAEYFRFQKQVHMTTGLGATISRATDQGNFTLLLAATILMAAMVVVINRFVWQRLYRLAETRFKLES